MSSSSFRSSSTTAPSFAPVTQSKYPMIPMKEAITLLEQTVDSLWLSSPSSVSSSTKQTQFVSHPDIVGCITAEPIIAPYNIPQYPCSRLDGYAVRSTEGPGIYPIQDYRRVGPSPSTISSTFSRPFLQPGQVMYITTGSPLPENADAIVKIEDTELVGPPNATTTVTTTNATQYVRIQGTVTSGEGVRKIGSDIHQHEILYPSGHCLTAMDIGSLLLARISEVSVFKRPRVGIVSSGDEIISPPGYLSNSSPSRSQPINDSSMDDQVWDSNRPMLHSLIHSCGGVPIDSGTIPDSEGLDRTKDRLLSIIANENTNIDILITTGGVSMGDRDYIKPALEALGGTVLFGRLLMKPGKPTTCAVVTHPRKPEKKVLVFALPGNPVSAAVCFHILVAPVIRRFQGLPWSKCHAPVVKVKVQDNLQLDPERPEYHRVIVWYAENEDKEGNNSLDYPVRSPSTSVLFAKSTGSQASSRMQSLSRVNGLLWLPRSSDILRKGTEVSAIMIYPPYSKEALPKEITESKDADKNQVIASCGCGHNHPGKDIKPEEKLTKEYPPHTIEGVNDNPVTAYPPIKVCVLTVSDRCSKGETKDTSGPAVITALQREIKNRTIVIVETKIVPDDVETIRTQLKGWTDREENAYTDIIFTTGGTGFSPRDVTPEATIPLLERRAPGIVHTMLNHSLRCTPMAALSRYEAGLRKNVMIINLPGSPKAVKECIEVLGPLVPHLVGLLKG